MTRRGCRLLRVLLGLLVAATATPAAAQAPEGQITWAYHISIATTWFDPADTPAIITPFTYYYAIHDALVKPMPGAPLAPSLAESWSVSSSLCTRRPCSCPSGISRSSAPMGHAWPSPVSG